MLASGLTENLFPVHRHRSVVGLYGFQQVSSKKIMPEYRLLVAVLLRAIRDACGDTRPTNATPSLVIRQAQSWINGTVNAEYELKFDDVCSHLKLSPGRIRKMISKWKSDPALVAGKPGAQDMDKVIEGILDLL